MMAFILKNYTCFSSLCNFLGFNIATKIQLSVSASVVISDELEMTVIEEQKLPGLIQILLLEQSQILGLIQQKYRIV